MCCAAPKCNLKIAAGVVRALCPDRTVESYIKYLTRNFIERSSYMTWCPAAGCEFVAMGSGVQDITCTCLTSFCKDCGRESHRPNSCIDIVKWDEKNQSEAENSNWILVNTKPCPGCSSRIEKNQGCNHMTCSHCRHEFCWICMEKWSTHGGSYFNCHKLKTNPETDESLATAKVILDR
jgi:ariadne-1